jgi:hypothetical protein
MLYPTPELKKKQQSSSMISIKKKKSKATSQSINIFPLPGTKSSSHQLAAASQEMCTCTNR